LKNITFSNGVISHSNGYIIQNNLDVLTPYIINVSQDVTITDLFHYKTQDIVIKRADCVNSIDRCAYLAKINPECSDEIYYYGNDNGPSGDRKGVCKCVKKHKTCDKSYSKYQGNINVTNSHKKCVKWSDIDSSLPDHNFCRNDPSNNLLLPPGKPNNKRLWCYTNANPRLWDYCSPDSTGVTVATATTNDSEVFIEINNVFPKVIDSIIIFRDFEFKPNVTVTKNDVFIIDDKSDNNYTFNNERLVYLYHDNNSVTFKYNGIKNWNKTFITKEIQIIKEATCYGIGGDGTCSSCDDNYFGKYCENEVTCNTDYGDCDKGTCSGKLGTGKCSKCNNSNWTGPNCDDKITCRNGNVNHNRDIVAINGQLFNFKYDINHDSKIVVSSEHLKNAGLFSHSLWKEGEIWTLQLYVKNSGENSHTFHMTGSENISKNFEFTVPGNKFEGKIDLIVDTVSFEGSSSTISYKDDLFVDNIQFSDIMFIHGDYRNVGKCNSCNEGWFGENCDIPVTCKNGVCEEGTCYGKDGTGICDRCDDGFVGENCDRKVLCENGICNEGTCSGKEGTGNCDECKSGFAGENCNIPVSCNTNFGDCEENCKGITGNGHCEPNSCTGKYIGDDCNIVGSCENGKTDPITGKCIHCNSGWTGENCDIKLNKYESGNDWKHLSTNELDLNIPEKFTSIIPKENQINEINLGSKIFYSN